MMFYNHLIMIRLNLHNLFLKKVSTSLNDLKSMAVPKALYIDKFENFMESIIILYLTDDEFKAICDDYCTSKINIEKYKKKSEEDRQSKADYESLSVELEEEILKFLSRYK